MLLTPHCLRHQLTDARVDPEQPLVLDALKQLPEVPGGARAGAVCPQIGSQDLHHRVAALVVGGGAGLGVGVRGAALLVPEEGHGSLLQSVDTRALDTESQKALMDWILIAFENIPQFWGHHGLSTVGRVSLTSRGSPGSWGRRLCRPGRGRGSWAGPPPALTTWRASGRRAGAGWTGP